MFRFSLLSLALALVLVLVSCGGGSAITPDGDLDSTKDLENSRTEDLLGVAVSPQTLLLDMNQGGYVVVHTAIKGSVVVSSSLELNGVPVSFTYLDSLGNIVGKFSETAIKAIVDPPREKMTLTGYYKDGTSFSGSDTVQVR